MFVLNYSLQQYPTMIIYKKIPQRSFMATMSHTNPFEVWSNIQQYFDSTRMS